MIFFGKYVKLNIQNAVCIHSVINANVKLITEVYDIFNNKSVEAVFTVWFDTLNPACNSRFNFINNLKNGLLV